MDVSNFNDLRAQNRFYYECVLANSKQFDLSEIWKNISSGDELYLTRDRVNTSNPYSVAVLYKCPDNQYKIIGHLPKSEKSEDIANILDLGWDKCGEFFFCRIMHNEFKDAEYQVRIQISIKKTKN